MNPNNRELIWHGQAYDKDGRVEPVDFVFHSNPEVDTDLDSLSFEEILDESFLSYVAHTKAGFEQKEMEHLFKSTIKFAHKQAIDSAVVAELVRLKNFAPLDSYGNVPMREIDSAIAKRRG